MGNEALLKTSLENWRLHEENAQAELRQAMKLEAIGRLAGGVAHDFKNLLTVINGYSELLLNRLSPLDANRGFVDEIKRAGQRASELTRQLLAFSRQQILLPEVVSLNTAVQGIDRMLRRLIGEDIEFITVLDPALRLVKVDPGQLDQVLMNLVLNARDAMPRGGKLTIETANVELAEDYVRSCADLKAGPYVLLALSDTGCGMTADVRARIFEPFFTTKDNGDGTGLGLATVHGIVKQSGGHIGVYSEPGHGTSFKVYLPAANEPATLHHPEILSGDVLGGSETILLAEDEEGVRHIARRALETYGYVILEAGNGCEALQVGQDFDGPIHLLVTDTIMPQMGGYELAQRLSRLRPDMKVLFTSGYTDDAIVRHGVLHSGTPFLQKPFTPQVLAAKVQGILHPPADVRAPALSESRGPGDRACFAS